MTPSPPDDDRPLGRTFREVDRKTPASEPWFMRAKRDYAAEEARRRTIVEEKMDQTHGYSAPPPFAMDEDPTLKTGDLVTAKMAEIEQELTAIRQIFAHLAPLDGAARKRVFGYVSEKLGDMP